MDAMIDAVGELFALVFRAATFEPAAHAQLARLEHMQRLAFLVPFLAGASEMAGQSATLVLNRVPRVRFAASLVVTGLIYILTALIWALSTLFLAHRLELASAPIGVVSAVIAVSFGPRLLGVLTIAPYYGEFLGRLLDGWMIAVAAFGIHIAVGLSGPLAALCSVLGWTVWIILRDGADRLLGPFIRYLEKAVMGAPLDLSFDNIEDIVRRRFTQSEEERRGDD